MPEDAVFPLCHSVPRADPKSAILSFAQGGDGMGFQFRRVFAVEHGEFDAVETRQAFLRADPEIAITSLNNRFDKIVRQSVFGLPKANRMRMPDCVIRAKRSRH